jgi:hypothetical protein
MTDSCATEETALFVCEFELAGTFRDIERYGERGAFKLVHELPLPLGRRSRISLVATTNSSAIRYTSSYS